MSFQLYLSTRYQKPPLRREVVVLFVTALQEETKGKTSQNTAEQLFETRGVAI